MTLPARNGCVDSTPVSRIAIVVPRAVIPDRPRLIGLDERGAFGELPAARWCHREDLDDVIRIGCRVK